MNYGEDRVVKNFEEKLDSIKDEIQYVRNVVGILFVLSLIANCSMKNGIIEKIENHEKTIINEIRKDKSSV